MKKVNVIVQFEKEKLEALQFYIGKKDADLTSEMEETLEKMYEKYVPQATREYIEDKMQRATKQNNLPRQPL